MKHTMEQMDPFDLLALHTAGARLQPQPTHALPQSCYRDPAQTVRFQSESRCRDCLYRRRGKQGVYCGQGQPYGKRCESFRIYKK